MKTLLGALGALLLAASPALAQQYQVVPACGDMTVPGGNSMGYMDNTGHICTAGGGGGGSNAAAVAVGSTAPASGSVTAGLVHAVPLNGSPTYTAGTVQPFTLTPQGQLTVDNYIGGFPMGDVGGGSGAPSGVHPASVAGTYNPTLPTATSGQQTAVQTDVHGRTITTTQQNLVALSAATVTTGGTAVTAMAAGIRTGGGWIANPSTATTPLCIAELGTAGVASGGSTTCIAPGVTYTVVGNAGAVSVNATDSAHAFSGYGFQ